MKQFQGKPKNNDNKGREKHNIDNFVLRGNHVKMNNSSGFDFIQNIDQQNFINHKKSSITVPNAADPMLRHSNNNIKEIKGGASFQNFGAYETPQKPSTPSFKRIHSAGKHQS